MAARRATKSIATGTSKSATALPPGTPAWISLELVEETVRVWQPRYERPLTTEDAVTILVNAGRLMNVLSLESEV
jgi:hypothetical protein